MISLDFSVTSTYPSTARWCAEKAETIWIEVFASRFLPDRRAVLPSNAITPAGMPVTAATQVTKQECMRISRVSGDGRTEAR